MLALVPCVGGSCRLWRGGCAGRGVLPDRDVLGVGLADDPVVGVAGVADVVEDLGALFRQVAGIDISVTEELLDDTEQRFLDHLAVALNVGLLEVGRLTTRIDQRLSADICTKVKDPPVDRSGLHAGTVGPQAIPYLTSRCNRRRSSAMAPGIRVSRRGVSMRACHSSVNLEWRGAERTRPISRYSGLSGRWMNLLLSIVSSAAVLWKRTAMVKATCFLGVVACMA